MLAADSLARHHGKAPSTTPRSGDAKKKWLCHTAKSRDGKQFINFTENSSCHICHVAKGKCSAGSAPTSEPTPMRPENSGRRTQRAQPASDIGEKQVCQALEAEAAKAKREAEALRKELRSSKAAAADRVRNHPTRHRVLARLHLLARKPSSPRSLKQHVTCWPP